MTTNSAVLSATAEKWISSPVLRALRASFWERVRSVGQWCCSGSSLLCLETALVGSRGQGCPRVEV